MFFLTEIAVDKGEISRPRLDVSLRAYGERRNLKRNLKESP